MSIVRKIVGWVRGLGFISLTRNTYRATDKPVVDMREALAQAYLKPNAIFSHLERLAAMSPAERKNYDLTSIARNREHIKRQIETAKKQKKARKHLYAALETLKTRELQIEAGQ